MNTQEQFVSPQSANEIDLQAADWLQRRNFWNWGADDEAALDAWISQSRTHKTAYWRQKAVWENAQRLAALRPSPSARAASAATSSFLPFILKAAAAVVAVAAIGSGAFVYLREPPYREAIYATPVGGRETITLFDGSQIELNTDTVLRVRKNANERTAILEKGEAFFDIRHDASRPFSVTAAGHRVVDLGTKFVVRNMPDRLEVSLIEGSASFGATAAGHPTLMKPGDVVVATAHATQRSRKTTSELGTELGWRRGLLTFYRATLADAAAEMNRYNERKITIADVDAGKELIDGTFPSNDVDLFGRVAHSVLGLRVTGKRDGIVISR